ncbi:membrane-bound ClpP family serine protease [Bacillus mesophilus]|uniref:Nodulation protein NfeD n=1 Tax=Bacillus mesophilus TaxID=1808955 RepID=A0A6M0Q802_9BACI|nr:NfeD family protein [Bacillus mesophilus]MBM7660823.1 membrane-bound ClpP family serine protease [Bacillus mesophilus]NEY71630.1 nodulation protein NfeD [Bacillus mesophilus]
MDFLLIPSVGFFILLLGTFFIVGEMLVKARGIFAILGLALIASYFTVHNTGDNFILILALYIAGLLLVFIDGKFVNDGTLAIIGMILMTVSVVIPAPTLLYGVLSGFGLIIGAFLSPLLLKILPSREMWSKITLKDRLTSEAGYNSVNSTHVSLLGAKGKTVTPFRPVGTIEIENNHYSAVSEGEWIESEVEIEVIKVEGTRMVIKRVEL